jgi:hypothetical protein
MKKTSNSNKLEKAQYDLYTYIDWLYNTGRITLEEHSKLVNAAADCMVAATVCEFFEKE